MPLIKILHLSDLHRANADCFRPQAEVETLLNDLERILGSINNGRTVDVVVISGDFVQSGSEKKEYQQIDNFISRLYAECISVDSKDKRRLVLVPGNHDVDWEKCRRALRAYPGTTPYETGQHRTSNDESRGFYYDQSIHREKFNNFAWVLRQSTGKDWPTDFEEQVLEYPICEPTTEGERGLVFIGLNSAYLVREDRNHAGLDSMAMNKAKKILRTTYPSDRWLRILVQHHPISFDDPPPDDHIRYAEISSLLGDFSLVLHGHIHHHAPRNQSQLGGGEVPAIGAGTFFGTTSARPDAVGLEYNLCIINTQDSSVLVYPRTRDDLGHPWRTDNRWLEDGKNFYSRSLREPGSPKSSQNVPEQSLAASQHPLKPIEICVTRHSLFEPLLEFAQQRDVVFALGGVGSGLKTFLAQFKTYLDSNGFLHYPAADFDIETFRLIQRAREKQSDAISEFTTHLDRDQIDLKCVLASIAYNTYHALREDFASAIDELVPALFHDDPVQYANHYFTTGSEAMFKAELAPIVQHFFETIQSYAEATFVDRVVVFMPWRNLSRCFHSPAEPIEKKAARDLWDALASFSSAYRESAKLSPFQCQNGSRVRDRYDKVCVIIAGTRAHFGHKPFKTSLVSKSIWPIPPLNFEELKSLLADVSEKLATDDLVEKVLDWTGGAPWYVRHLLSYMDYHYDRYPEDVGKAFSCAVQGAREALIGNPRELPASYCDFVTRHIDRMKEELGCGQSTDSAFVEYWTSSPRKRRRGFSIASPRDEAWISSGLAWFDGTVWDHDASDHVFRDYPTVYFRKAARLPVALYRAIASGFVPEEN